MITRRPRAVMAVAVAVLVSVLAVFAAALLDANRDERADAERRLTDRAKVSAALTDSLFTSTTQAAQPDYARRFAGDVSGEALDRFLRRNRSTGYAAVLDDRGIPLAVSGDTPREALQRIASRPAEVRDAQGTEVGISDVLDFNGGFIHYVVPFRTGGEQRKLLQGIPVTFLDQFLGNYLASIPGAERTDAYVIDSTGRVVGSPVERQAAGEPVEEVGLVAALEATGDDDGSFASAGGDRHFGRAAVGDSPWRVVLTVPQSVLYGGISSTVEWLILIVLGLVGVLAIGLLGRSLNAAVALQGAFSRLERTNAELEHSNLELKRSNAELEQFASVASHDLQEPLRKVQSFGDQLERRFGDQIPEDATDYLRRMRNAANRMSTLIEDLLRFSRVTTHAKPPQRVDLGAVAREVTSDLSALVAETHGTVEIGELPTLQADRVQMRQLMQNLIANALKFHRPGVEPVVTVAEQPGAEPGHVRFSVRDNGIGFEREYEERIFRVFERLHPRDVYAGTGIGLALCRKIVERHGGTITAHGRPDEGAEFVVTMPTAQPASPGPTVAITTMETADEREPAHV